MVKNISNSLIGLAGEYYVCAELCRRGYLALLTPKNNPLYDVAAMTPDGTKSINIQVKTMSIENKQGWKLGKDVTAKKQNPRLFIVLVNLSESGVGDFYIYRYDSLADIIDENYRKYMSKPKRDGTARKEVRFRWHNIMDFTKRDWNKKNNWDPIEKALK
jgi:hypothetical protein